MRASLQPKIKTVVLQGGLFGGKLIDIEADTDVLIIHLEYKEMMKFAMPGLPDWGTYVYRNARRSRDVGSRRRAWYVPVFEIDFFPDYVQPGLFE